MNMNIETQDLGDSALVAVVNIQNAAQAIPLDQLVPSKANVRRVNATAGVSELAESIEAHGLIHNLTVRKAKKGRYEVVAGSRRLAALRLLVKEGRLAGDAEIPCNVREDNDTELSLAENVQREAMHIVDEILAFRELAEGGMEPERIASRFGQSVVTVRQRLKLAALSPKLLEVMREDALSVEQAKALAISDSHEAQERVWFETPSYQRDPRSLRSLLTREHVRSSDRLARFIGLEAYQAAGGAVVRDLFGDDAGTYLADQPLLTQLVMDQLERIATPVRNEGWKWVEASLETGAAYNGSYGRIHPKSRMLTDEEEGTVTLLSEQVDALQTELEALHEDDLDVAAKEEQVAELEAQIEAIRGECLSYEPSEQAIAGAIIYVDHYGEAVIARGYVKSEDRAELETLRGSGSCSGADTSPAPSASGPDGGYSATLTEELTAIRTAAMRIELANRPSVALAALLYPLVGRIFHVGSMTYGTAIEISGQQRQLASSIKEPAEARALAAWEAMHEAWGDTLPGQSGDLWDWLLTQSVDKLLELLSFVAAANLNAVKVKGDFSKERLANAEQIAVATALDMKAHWNVDARFLGRLSKTDIASVLTEAGCAIEAVRAVERLPKVNAVVEAERLMQGREWLPPVFRAGQDRCA